MLYNVGEDLKCSSCDFSALHHTCMDEDQLLCITKRAPPSPASDRTVIGGEMRHFALSRTEDIAQSLQLH